MKKLLILLMLGIFTYGCGPCGTSNGDKSTVIQFYSGGNLIETKTFTNNETILANDNRVTVIVNENERIYYYGDIKITEKTVRKNKSEKPKY